MPVLVADQDIEQLTIDERIDLIGRLWDSIPDSQIPIPDWHRDLLRERIADANQNPDEWVSVEEFRAELLGGG